MLGEVSGICSRGIAIVTNTDGEGENDGDQWLDFVGRQLTDRRNGNYKSFLCKATLPASGSTESIIVRGHWLLTPLGK